MTLQIKTPCGVFAYDPREHHLQALRRANQSIYVYLVRGCVSQKLGRVGSLAHAEAFYRRVFALTRDSADDASFEADSFFEITNTGDTP